MSRRSSGGGVSAQGPAEQKNVRLGSVDFVMHPASTLLHSQCAPLRFREQSSSRHLLEDMLGQVHVPVFVEVVRVLLGVFDFGGEVGHL